MGHSVHGLDLDAARVSRLQAGAGADMPAAAAMT
jgi:hypothetical protein